MLSQEISVNIFSFSGHWQDNWTSCSYCSYFVDWCYLTLDSSNSFPCFLLFMNSPYYYLSADISTRQWILIRNIHMYGHAHISILDTVGILRIFICWFNTSFSQVWLLWQALKSVSTLILLVKLVVWDYRSEVPTPDNGIFTTLMVLHLDASWKTAWQSFPWRSKNPPWRHHEV